MVGVEEWFNNFFLEERVKFDVEIFINVNNLRKKIMVVFKFERLNNEYIVVMILVVVDGEFKFLVINSNVDFKVVFRKLGLILIDVI